MLAVDPAWSGPTGYALWHDSLIFSGSCLLWDHDVEDVLKDAETYAGQHGLPIQFVYEADSFQGVAWKLGAAVGVWLGMGRYHSIDPEQACAVRSTTWRPAVYGKGQVAAGRPAKKVQALEFARQWDASIDSHDQAEACCIGYWYQHLRSQ